MNKNFRGKWAVFMACASVLGGNTSAMNTNKFQNQQTFKAVGGEQSGKKGLTKNQKLAIGTVAVPAIILTILGVKKKWSKYYKQKSYEQKSFDYVTGVHKFLTDNNEQDMLKLFDTAINKIKAHEFSEEDKNTFKEFLEVIKEGKKVKSESEYSTFKLNDGTDYGKVIYVRIDNFYFGISFKNKKLFGILKCDRDSGLLNFYSLWYR